MPPRPAIVVALSSLISASALRTVPWVENGTAGSFQGVQNAELEEEREDQELEFLPPLDRYERLWQGMYNLEERLHQPLPSSVQLVLGVMTVANPNSAKYRDIIRSTWGSQRGVCYWSRDPKPGCSVYIAFVMGRPPAGWNEVTTPSLQEEGALELDMVENMNSGKSPTWMATALRMFPWATHYGKVDMDAYPFLHKLVLRMDRNSSCVSDASPYEWIGRPVFWGGGKAFSGACEPNPCHGWFYSKMGWWHMGKPQTYPREPFRYLLGGMYLLSHALVRDISWSPREGTEDVVMGHFVSDFIESKGEKQCVAVRRLDAEAHMVRHQEWDAQDQQHIVDRVFANDLDANYAEGP